MEKQAQTYLQCRYIQISQSTSATHHTHNGRCSHDKIQIATDGVGAAIAPVIPAHARESHVT